MVNGQCIPAGRGYTEYNLFNILEFRMDDLILAAIRAIGKLMGQ